MRWWVVSAMLCGCVGPEATDAAVCRDVIARLCGAPRCGLVDAQLGVDDGCDAQLTVRTGCGSDDFTFSTPSRQRVLDCRVPLLRQGASVFIRPACEDVTASFTQCPDVVTFFQERP